MSLTDKILSEAILEESKTISFSNPNYNNLVVMMGSPGAGKSFTINTVINLRNYKLLNSDTFIEMIAKKQKLDLKNPDVTYDLHMKHRNKAKKFRNQFLGNQMGKIELPNVVIDVTGSNQNELIKINELGHYVGYSTTLVYVRTHIDTAIKRNMSRPRSIPTQTLVDKYHEVSKTYSDVMEEFDHVWIRNNDEEYNPEYKDGKYIRPFNQIIKVK